MKKNVAMAGLMILAAVVRSRGETGFGPGQSMAPVEALKEARASEAPAAPEIIAADKPVLAIEWVSIQGGKFQMGTNDGDEAFKDAKPVHEVSLKTFELSKTLVTVEQYAQCVSQGACTKPGTSDSGDYCNWGKAARRRHPINCVTWDQANDYAKFKGARLPSESEYEYAATSGGKNRKYPWGDEAATCEKAVMHGDGGVGCSDGTMPVCSKSAGNTEQGLCDMAGNVWEWVQDKYQGSYAGAPADGGAFEASGSYRVLRGGSFYADKAKYLRIGIREHLFPSHGGDDSGFRLARSSR